jgi:hypothetical protein
MQRANARLGGQALDDAGTPVRYAKLNATESQQGFLRTSRTDGEGRFDFGLTQGTWSLRLYSNGQEPSVFGSNLTVAVTSGQITPNLVYPAWRATRRLTGFLRDAAARPLSGVGVYASSPNGYANGLTDRDGRYQFAVSDGDWWVYLDPSDLELFGFQAPVGQLATVFGADVELDFVASPLPTAASLALTGFDSRQGSRLRITGLPGLTYQIQASSNLQAWPPIRSLTVPQNRHVELVDPSASRSLQGFYRAVSP